MCERRLELSLRRTTPRLYHSRASFPSCHIWWKHNKALTKPVHFTSHISKVQGYFSWFSARISSTWKLRVLVKGNIELFVEYMAYCKANNSICSFIFANYVILCLGSLLIKLEYYFLMPLTRNFITSYLRRKETDSKHLTYLKVPNQVQFKLYSRCFRPVWCSDFVNLSC